MNIGKKAALLSVAAGALVLGSAAGASAHGLDPFGTIQTNSCETTTSAITHGAADLAGTVGDINIGADCINFSNSGAAVQSNDCDTATGIITHGAASLAPTGDINVGAHCTNIAIDDNPYADKGYADKGYGSNRSGNKSYGS